MDQVQKDPRVIEVYLERDHARSAASTSTTAESHILRDVELSIPAGSCILPHGPQRRRQDDALEKHHGRLAAPVRQDPFDAPTSGRAAPSQRARSRQSLRSPGTRDPSRTSTSRELMVGIEAARRPRERASSASSPYFPR